MSSRIAEPLAVLLTTVLTVSGGADLPILQHAKHLGLRLERSSPISSRNTLLRPHAFR